MVPILTPLTPQEKVDVSSLRRLVNYLIENGIHGIWAAGTTGEFAALSDADRRLTIETVVQEANGRVPVVGNISAAGTASAIEIARSLQSSGLDGLALTPPYYYNYGQDELLNHYRQVQKISKVPLWVYNIPSAVKVSVDPATVFQLATEGTVVGIKDSSGGGETLAQLVVLCHQQSVQMYRFLGSVYRVTMTGVLGAHGVIPGLANVAASAFSGAWEAGESGEEQQARENLASVVALQKLLGLARGGGPNASAISGLKSALKIMGIIDHDTVTQPMRPLAEEEKAQIPDLLQKARLPTLVVG